MSAIGVDGSERHGLPPAFKRPLSRRRVVAINRFYWPDHAATSQILTDLASFLASQGWEVRVVTSRLRYDGGAPLASREVKDRVQIRRVWTSRIGRARLAGRAMDYLTFHASAGLTLLREVGRGDIVLVTTDPPLFSIVASSVARLKGARLVTWNHDVFPEVAGVLGLSWLRGHLGRLLVRLRNRAMRAPAINVALSATMAERLERSGVDAGSLRVIPNWSDAEIRPVAREDNRLRREWRLGENFVIGYSGNLGRAHMAEKVADLVRRTHDLPGLSWLFIGSGSGMSRIRNLASELDQGRLQIRPYQPRTALSHSLSAPDLHLVSLDPVCEGLIVPSKISGVLAAGRPVLYLGDPENDLAQEIVGRGVGLCLDPAAPESWRETISELKDDPHRLREMGRKALAWVESESPDAMQMRWKRVLVEATGTSPAEVG